MACVCLYVYECALLESGCMFCVTFPVELFLTYLVPNDTFKFGAERVNSKSNLASRQN